MLVPLLLIPNTGATNDNKKNVYNNKRNWLIISIIIVVLIKNKKKKSAKSQRQLTDVGSRGYDLLHLFIAYNNNKTRIIIINMQAISLVLLEVIAMKCLNSF